MARKIIVLDQTGMPSDRIYNVAFWLTVPVARQPFLAKPTATSQVVGPNAPTAAELLAIQQGAIIEQIVSVPYVAGQSNASILADLVVRYNAAQLASDSNNYWNFYGTNWDGTTWTPVTVA